MDKQEMIYGLRWKYGDEHEYVSSFIKFCETNFAQENPNFIEIVYQALITRPHRREG